MSLTPAERTRLIRTTRKLGAMLGDTPTISISEPSTRPNSPTPSSKPTCSLRSHSPPRINVTIPLTSSLYSPTDPVSRSPLSPTFSRLNRDPIICPPSPTLDDVPDAKRMRRLKIAKLTHTFGQNVPPELITDRTLSASQFDEKRSFASYETDLFNTDLFNTKSEGDDSSVSSTVASLESANLIPPPSRAGKSLRLPSRAAGRHSYAAPVDTTSKKSNDKKLSVRRPSTAEDAVEGRQRQRSWLGEWNQDDMETIRKRLRKLK